MRFGHRLSLFLKTIASKTRLSPPFSYHRIKNIKATIAASFSNYYTTWFKLIRDSAFDLLSAMPLHIKALSPTRNRVDTTQTSATVSGSIFLSS